MNDKLRDRGDIVIEISNVYHEKTTSVGLQGWYVFSICSAPFTSAITQFQRERYTCCFRLDTCSSNPITDSLIEVQFAHFKVDTVIRHILWS